MIAVVVVGLIGAQHYVRRGIEGRFHGIGEGFGFVYTPKRTTGDVTLSVKRAQLDAFTTVIEPDPDDPLKEISTTTIDSTVSDDTQEQRGTETVDVAPRATLFN